MRIGASSPGPRPDRSGGGRADAGRMTSSSWRQGPSASPGACVRPVASDRSRSRLSFRSSHPLFRAGLVPFPVADRRLTGLVALAGLPGALSDQVFLQVNLGQLGVDLFGPLLASFDTAAPLRRLVARVTRLLATLELFGRLALGFPVWHFLGIFCFALICLQLIGWLARLAAALQIAARSFSRRALSVEKQPATSARSLIATGNPANQPG